MLLSYNDIGEGIPLVLIHGLGQRKESWISQLELADKYRLILVDLRGHGSTVLNEDITLKNMAKDVIKLLEHLNIESTYIAGISLGGIISQEIYSQRPDMVKGLILANTTSYIPFVPNFNSNKPFDEDKLIEFVAKTSLHNQEYLEEAKKAFYIRDTYIESSRAAMGLNYYPLLPLINVPVLLIAGRQDKVTPLHNILSMAQWIRNKEVVILEDCGHLSNIEQREKFNDYVDMFIQENQ